MPKVALWMALWRITTAVEQPEFSETAQQERNNIVESIVESTLEMQQKTQQKNTQKTQQELRFSTESKNKGRKYKVKNEM